jgi:L-cysteine S-thiosulfotransferase
MSFAWLIALLLIPLSALAQKTSGFEAMSPALQAMQRDDSQNPAMLWVQDGAQLWARGASRSCASCHGDAAQSMRGVAARYPAFDTRTAKPLNLAQRVNQCRSVHQGQPPWPAESAELLGLTAYIGLQSRGLPLVPPIDTRLEPARARGQVLFERRIGQLQLSCAMCHDANPGRRLAGSLIPPGHVNGYPLYRLEWQGLGSLQRRLRNCMTGVRAEPYAWDAPALIELELYLSRRSAGLPLETPAVRP